MSTEEQQEVREISAEQLAEVLKAAAPTGPTKIIRTILPSPGMKYGKLTELASDVVYQLAEGAPEPMALSFFTPDGSEAYIMVVSPAMKAALLNALTGGIELATPADLAKEVAKA